MLLHPDVLKAMSNAGECASALHHRERDPSGQAPERSRAAAIASRLRPRRVARTRLAATGSYPTRRGASG